MFTDPTVQEFKDYFTRDFPYGTDPSTVMDSDISRAELTAASTINQCLFGVQEFYSQCFLLLSAHYLVMNLRASSQGISGQYAWMVTSKGVGSVSEGITVPQKILDNPLYAMLSKTTYGAMYLELMMPLLAGQMFVAYGRTLP
jgi:hypothetical protein